MKYGIKHNAGVIEAISQFRDNIVPVGFVELTKALYEGFLDKMAVNPFYTFDEPNMNIVQNISALAAAQNADLKAKKRSELLTISNELALQSRMGEDTTATQTAFNDLKAEYNALNSPPP